MTIWRWFGLCLLAGSVVLAPRAALGCELVVEADEEVRALWPELPDRLRGTLTARPGLDSCVHIELRRQGSSLTVRVSLPDGRSAARDVPEQQDVLPTLEALLLLPGELQTEEPSAPPSVVPSRQPPMPRSAQPSSQPVRARMLPMSPTSPERDSTPTSSRGPGFELTLLGSARVGDGQSAWGLAALSSLNVSGWLAGFEGRASGYTNMQTAQTYPTLQLATLVGHRLQFGGTALDVVAGPAVALLGENTVQEGPAEEEHTTSGFVPRLALGTHLNFGMRSVLRAVVGVEGELGPAGPSGDGVSAPPPLPAWMMGLAVGVTVGTI